MQSRTNRKRNGIILCGFFGFDIRFETLLQTISSYVQIDTLLKVKTRGGSVPSLLLEFKPGASDASDNRTAVYMFATHAKTKGPRSLAEE